MSPARRLLFPAALLLSLASAAAQEAVQDRPPVRPAEAAAPEARPDATENAEPEAAEPAPAPVFIGPPTPPAWWQLALDQEGHAACLVALREAGAIFTEEPRLTDPEDPDCGIARPVALSRITSAVALPDEPLLHCEAALALARWSRDFLEPAALALPEAEPLAALRTGPGYACRARVGTGEADPKPSEHGLGYAIDIAAFDFAGRESLPVQPRRGDADADEAFQRAARATACLLFTTVLGPGSNAAHDDHLHLDLAIRSSGWRLCD